MTDDSYVQLLGIFTPQQTTVFLAHLSHRLTVLMRECYEYDGGGIAHAPRARRINEIEHRITSMLIDMASHGESDYNLSELLEAILASQDDELARKLKSAVNHAAEAASASKSP